ncbi:hypothetical protein [Butyricicoccus sp.]|uniref:hypothetical protein n=1 Tax=Butyricicoccus sp. TaxID=2049021 RepID=UPI003735C8D1
MRISRNGEDWGEITVRTDGQQVHFHARGTLPKYGEILRVWGMRDGAQPLLIGVAEPDGDGLAVNRTMSRQYLASLGYAELPERYFAGIRASEIPSGTHAETAQTDDPLVRQAMQDRAVSVRREEDRDVLSCAFEKNHAFPLAFACCCCTVKSGRAQLVWDRKKGCPVWTAP